MGQIPRSIERISSWTNDRQNVFFRWLPHPLGKPGPHCPKVPVTPSPVSSDGCHIRVQTSRGIESSMPSCTSRTAVCLSDYGFSETVNSRGFRPRHCMTYSSMPCQRQARCTDTVHCVNLVWMNLFSFSLFHSAAQHACFARAVCSATVIIIFLFSWSISYFHGRTSHP